MILWRRLIVSIAIAVAVPLAAVPISATPAAPATAHLHLVHGHSAVVGHGPLRRFRVEVQSSLRKDRDGFTKMVLRTLGDGRDWGHDYRFRRVSKGHYRFTVVLATPHETNRLCAPLNTASILSCYNDGRSVINSYRWNKGAATYHWNKHLTAYRRYVISHEIGHALGHGHVTHCRTDGLAPTMMQQTKSLYGCRRNPWPYPHAHQ